MLAASQTRWLKLINSCSGRFAQQCVFEFEVRWIRAEPDAHQRCVKLGFFEGLALLFAFNADDGACAWNSVVGET